MQQNNCILAIVLRKSCRSLMLLGQIIVARYKDNYILPDYCGVL